MGDIPVLETIRFEVEELATSMREWIFEKERASMGQLWLVEFIST